jgi:hypothetical protein
VTGDERERTRAGEWIRVVLLGAVVIAAVTLLFVFALTNGFASCCTQPAPGFTTAP